MCKNTKKINVFIHFYFNTAFIYTLHKMFASESFKLLVNSMLHKSCNHLIWEYKG